MAYSYKGAITFGLVYIPITLSLSVKEHDIGFNMLEKNTKSRVKYKKTCVDCDNKEVKNEDIVKGYQYEKDKYVIFTEKDFEKIKTKKDKNITIEQFVNLDEIDPIYFDKAYYVKPQGGDKAYNVLLKAMEEEKKAGIAKTVFGTKETLVLIRARDGKMLVNTLYFHSEIQKAPSVETSKIAKKELDLAKSLILQMTGKFEPQKYKDEYYERLKKAIKRKIAGNEIIEAKEDKEPIKIINLMEALQKSIETKPKRAKAE
ncbi:MAG: Ku protein [Clostridiales bacterium]|nr:Ku protein [Clostridiales bacterium]